MRPSTAIYKREHRNKNNLSKVKKSDEAKNIFSSVIKERTDAKQTVKDGKK